MSQPAVDIRQNLLELQNAYLKKIPVLISELEQLYSLLTSSKNPQPVLLELKRKVHSFIGSSGTFNFHDLSKKAREFEKILLSIDDSVSQIDSVKLNKLWSHLVAIKGMAQRIPIPQEATTQAENTHVTNLFICRPLNILFAGDDEQIQKKFILDLHDSNHTLIFAHNGEDAVEKFNQQQFGLVVLEIVMPQMNGFQTATLIRQQSSDKYVPILFLTSADRERELIKCIECGGDDFLIKPYKAGILNAKIFSLDRMSQLINRN